jgi:hypothetical protein
VDSERDSVLPHHVVVQRHRHVFGALLEDIE